MLRSTTWRCTVQRFPRHLELGTSGRSRGQTATNKSSLPRDSQPVQIKHLGMTWWYLVMYVVPLHLHTWNLPKQRRDGAWWSCTRQPAWTSTHTSCMCGVGNGELVPWFQDFGCSKNLKTMYTITVYSDCTNNYSCVDRRFRRFQVLFRCSSLICALERTWSHESLPKSVHV